SVNSECWAPGIFLPSNPSDLVGRECSEGPSPMAVVGAKTAFVFSGGGSLGAIQVGMLRVLLTYGLKPVFVVGASVGAINAAYFASAPDVECVARLEQIWSGLRRADIFPFTLTSAFGLIRHRGYIVDPSGLRRVVKQICPVHGSRTRRFRFTSW